MWSSPHSIGLASIAHTTMWQQVYASHLAVPVSLSAGRRHAPTFNSIKHTSSVCLDLMAIMSRYRSSLVAWDNTNGESFQ